MGKTRKPAVIGMFPNKTTFVSNKLDATMHTQKRIPNIMKETDTVLFFIFLVFYEVKSSTRPPKRKGNYSIIEAAKITFSCGFLKYF